MLSEKTETVTATEPEKLELQSVEYIAEPRDKRCQYWAKLYRAGDRLPETGNVEGGASLPGKFLRKGADVELYEGDAIIEAEANHHRKLRGWVVRCFVVRNGALVRLPTDTSAKSAIKAANLDSEIKRGLLSGSGTVAAAVRALHCVRLQIEVVATND